MYEIVTTFTGANLKILEKNENGAKVDVELRDTIGDWFYWCFKVTGAAGKTLTFTFPSEDRIGYYGAAVSYDFQNWHWQYETPEYSGNSFTYSFGKDENEVYFSHNLGYSPERFYSFAKEQNLEIKTLCISEKGRKVPYIDTESGEECIFLTARHHACEATGSYVLEGVIKEIMAEFSDKFRIICVPFVDFDGVVDGDQGKNRNGKDHNRDYTVGERALYKTTEKIRELAEGIKVRFAFDFHSPWHLGGVNDTVFLAIGHYHNLKNITRFSNIFEKCVSKDALPHYATDDVHPDIDWNKSNSDNFANYMDKKGAELAYTLETPYFKANGVCFTPDNAVETGKCFVKALNRYLKRSFRVAVTGDILYEQPINSLCKTESGYDFRRMLLPSFPRLLNADFLITSPETPFAGKEFGYTNERYCFNTPVEALEDLKKNGFDLVTLANNHCMDRKIEGIYATASNCERVGINYIGISKGKRNAIHILNIGDRKAAFVNATYGTNAFAHRNFLKDKEIMQAVATTQPEETLLGSVHLLETNEEIAENVERLYNPECEEVKPFLNAIAEDIQTAKEQADYVIMLLHSGGQYNNETDPYTVMLCEKIKAMGADMIITNHPHIILPSKTDDDGFFTAYSLGNLLSTGITELDSPINQNYSAVLNLDFENGVDKPKLSFGIYKASFNIEGKTPPVVENAYDLYIRTKDEKIKSEALFMANRFSGQIFTELKPEFKF